MKNNLIPLTLAVSVLMACGKNTETKEVQTLTSPTVSNVIATDDSDWPLKADKYDANYNVRIIKYEMTDAQKDAERNLYRETDLQPFPIDPSFKTQLFRIHNVPDYQNILFIPPKLWVYGYTDGGRTAPVLNENGTVTIHFPIILTSGVNSEVPAPSELKKVTVPESLLISNAQEIKKIYDKNLASLPGCPKKVIVSFNNIEYDATPTAFKKGDYCDLERPVVASVTLKKMKPATSWKKLSMLILPKLEWCTK